MLARAKEGVTNMGWMRGLEEGVGWGLWVGFFG